MKKFKSIFCAFLSFMLFCGINTPVRANDSSDVVISPYAFAKNVATEEFVIVSFNDGYANVRIYISGIMTYSTSKVPQSWDLSFTPTHNTGEMYKYMSGNLKNVTYKVNGQKLEISATLYGNYKNILTGKTIIGKETNISFTL